MAVDEGAARVDGERLWASLMDMARIGATDGGGCNRPALSDIDAEARRTFAGWVGELGAELVTDEVANLFAVLPGSSDEPAVLLGSHLDTQPTGGRFDGVYGVLGALEVARTVRDRGITTRRPLVLAVWTNEEGSRFPRAMLGSAVWSGVLPLDTALGLVDDDGTTVAQAIDALGFAPPRGTLPELGAAFELHIEQGPVLEATDTDIGVVTGVLGLRWYDLELRGVSAHAGPTPMADRHDPVRALGALSEQVHRLVERSGPSARATFARLRSEPASHNTVAERITLTLDLRHEHDDELDALEHGVQELLDTTVAELGVQATLTRRDATAAVHFAPGCIDAVERSAEALGLSRRRIVSGAGHDSCYVAARVPTSMIFVPCRGGLSHNEAESITPAQAEHGASVLLGAVLDVAGAS